LVEFVASGKTTGVDQLGDGADARKVITLRARIVLNTKCKTNVVKSEVGRSHECGLVLREVNVGDLAANIAVREAQP